jgi:hypothetical protein
MSTSTVDKQTNQRTRATATRTTAKGSAMNRKPIGVTVPYRLLEKKEKRTWVGLTDEEKADIAAQGHQRWKEYAEAIEAKLKEKNT